VRELGDEMIIEGVSKEETSYAKEMLITYDGQQYEVLLRWNNWDGYELSFVGSDEPEWAIEWEDNNEESLAFTLDSLTDEVLEASYL
jgi:hypothetical protein